MERTVPARFRYNRYVLLRESARCARGLIFDGCQEIFGEVGLPTGRYPAAALMPSDGDGREHQSEKAENRDRKEDIHVPVRRITRCMGFVHLIRWSGVDLAGVADGIDDS